MKMFKMTTGGGGQALLRNKQGAVKRALLYILTPIFCAALCVGAVFSFFKTDNGVYAATGSAPASIISLDGNFASKLQGEQNEYIYFGKNSGAAVKWRVLSTGADNKYDKDNSGNQRGNMLLWADKQIAVETYNSGPDQTTTSQPNYAYWSTSKIRASLNGGGYPANVTGTDMPSATMGGMISTDKSWYGKLFPTDDEKYSVVATGSYTTDNWGLDTNLSQYVYKTSGITTNNYEVNGKYNENILGTGTASSAVKTSNGGVQDTTSGDRLFLLDYYDINNTNYGFGDDGLTYAKKIDSNWSAESDYYPGYYTGSGKSFNNITSDYLKFSGEAVDYYWLRPTGRVGLNSSSAFFVLSSGSLDTHRGVSRSGGVRPAFNLNASNVVYATAASLDTVNSTLSSVVNYATTADNKPAYKVYTKNSSYAANNSTAKAKIAINDKTLNVAYNNPTVTTAGSGVTSGKLVLLLSKNGAVEYQAEQPMNGAATNMGTKTTTFTLPDGLNYKDYTANLLFTSANGGVASEVVYCSYNVENSSVDIPADVNMTYDGKSKWVGDLQGADVPDWYDKEVHGSTSFVTVESILYTDNDGDYTDEPVEANAVKAAGKYKVTLVLADGLKWSSGDATDNKRSFYINIAKAAPNVNVAIDGEVPHFVPSKLPDIKLDETKDNTAGEVKWKDTADNKPKAGPNYYTWAFTPTDTNNYLTKDDGQMLLTFYAPEIDKVEIINFNPDGKDIFTTTTLGEFTKLFKVKVSYKDNAKEAEENYKDFTVVVNNKTIDPTSTTSFLKVGNNTLKVRVKDAAKNNAIIESLSITITDVKELGFEELNSIALDTAEFVYPVTAQQILDDIVEISVKLNDGTSDFANKSDDAEKFASFLANIELVEDASTLNAGDSVNVTFRIKGLETEVAKYEETIKITKGTYDIPDSVFVAKTVTYTGKAIDLDGWINLNDLPTGMTVTYSCDTDLIEVGNYVVTATFSNPDTHNYNDPKPKTATLTISDKKQYKPDNLSFTVSGATGDDGKYTATYDPAKTISFVLDGKLLDKDGNEVDESVVTVTRDYKYQKKVNGAWVDATADELKGAGTYRVSVTISTDDEAYDDVKMIAELTIDKADVDVKGAEVKPTGANSGLTADGNGGFTGTYKPDGKFELNIDKNDLPANVTPKEPVYKKLKEGGNPAKESDWLPVEKVDGAGDYKVVVELEPNDPDNYNEIKPIEVSLKINKAEVESVSAEVEEGAQFDINSTLEDVIAKIKAEISYNNGEKEDVKVEDLTITCTTLREGGLLEVGKQTITVKYDDGIETTVEIVVGKAKVALPVYSGTITYSGSELKPASADFTGYDSALMSFVESKTMAGLNAGTYKAVFALKDSDRYEWATKSATKKAVFAVAYDEISIDPNVERVVDWTLEKAVITATMGADGKPVFKSGEIPQSILAQAIGVKYFTDEACTQEVSADELAYETTYYRQAELIDSTNFKLDGTVAQVLNNPPYTHPAKQLTVWEKIVKFLSANWLWIVIAVVALILLITIIALIARAAKKKREREEQRRLEEKAERERKEERDREERRLEREERMARMNQQQAMPQMIPQMMQMPQMQMPQQPPQYAPQAQGQPAATGGGTVSEAQFLQMQAELKAEISALKAEQSAKEIAALRAEVAMRDDISVLRSEGGRQIQPGMNVEAMTEIMTMALKNVLASAAQPVLAAQPAQPAQLTDGGAPTATPNATTQIPPDAVMTTVTTTKIDTTKKPAQASDRAAAPAPAGRTVVRNYVAPMPVDDGRVFDVGGFYKPADPVTDGIDNLPGEEPDKKE